MKYSGLNWINWSNKYLKVTCDVMHKIKEERRNTEFG